MTEANVSTDAQAADVDEAQVATEENVEASVDAPEANDDTQVTTNDDDLSAVEREREARRKANREAQNLRERLKKFEEAEEQRKQAAMSDLEKANTRAEKFEREHKEALAAAESTRKELTALRVKQEATNKALANGAKHDRIDAVIRLTDLSEAVDEEGNPDPKAVEDAVKATLKDYSEFRSGASNVGGQTNPGNPPQAKKSVADMSDEEFRQLSQRVQWGERVTL